MYIVPEDLREDFENYRNKVERDDAVLYRYSRRRINKQIVILTKIGLVLGTGFLMLVLLCKLTEKGESAESARQYLQYGQYNHKSEVGMSFGAPIGNNRPSPSSAVYVPVQISIPPSSLSRFSGDGAVYYIFKNQGQGVYATH
ncbi:hypothetical protein GC174_17195 [bacterium]|nr:hypothetical protein [bacterium]